MPTIVPDRQPDTEISARGGKVDDGHEIRCGKLPRGPTLEFPSQINRLGKSAKFVSKRNNSILNQVGAFRPRGQPETNQRCMAPHASL